MDIFSFEIDGGEPYFEHTLALVRIRATRELLEIAQVNGQLSVATLRRIRFEPSRSVHFYVKMLNGKNWAASQSIEEKWTVTKHDDGWAIHMVEE